MTDVKIELYYEYEDEPLTTVDGSYEDFARLETRSIVNRVTTAFEFHVDDMGKYKMVLEDRDVVHLERNWVPFNTGGELDEDQVRHELQAQAEELVREWRSNGYE